MNPTPGLSPSAQRSPKVPAAATGDPSATRPAGAASGSPPAVQAPPVQARFDYQIGGSYPPSRSVGIVDRDHDAEREPSVTLMLHLAIIRPKKLKSVHRTTSTC